MAISNVTRRSVAALWGTSDGTLADLLDPIGWWSGDLNEVEFLERLYRLNEMPSTDDRYPDARGDIRQHCVNNNDWEGLWVLADARFGLDDDTRLLSFLAETVHPEVRNDRNHGARLVEKYNSLLRRDGVELAVSAHISGMPVYTGRRYLPSDDTIRDALADAISSLKAYDVPGVCERVGLGPSLAEYGDPMSSKRSYVKRHAAGASRAKLLEAARATAAIVEDIDLRAIVDATSDVITGVHHPPKNIIFAANGPKPELVLRDAINNDIEITKNAEFCLVYSRALTDEGLSWQDLIDWWTETRPNEEQPDVVKDLYHRLRSSLSTTGPGEGIIFRAYSRLYREIGYGLPALLPQVYLHLDPRTQITAAGVLFRQRMDFLLLLPKRHRIVIELDGMQHYATDDGGASPQRYAAMMRADRQIRLRGYEVYRFGGAEVTDKHAEPMLRQFFIELLTKHGIGTATKAISSDDAAVELRKSGQPD